MESVGLKIDEERGVAIVFGEEIRLAAGFKGDEKGCWRVYADVLEPDKKYIITVCDKNGDITMIWSGYYRPDMFAFKIYPIWNANRAAYKPVFVSERIVMRKPLKDATQCKTLI